MGLPGFGKSRITCPRLGFSQGNRDHYWEGYLPLGPHLWNDFYGQCLWKTITIRGSYGDQSLFYFENQVPFLSCWFPRGWYPVPGAQLNQQNRIPAFEKGRCKWPPHNLQGIQYPKTSGATIFLGGGFVYKQNTSKAGHWSMLPVMRTWKKINVYSSCKFQLVRHLACYVFFGKPRQKAVIIQNHVSLQNMYGQFISPPRSQTSLAPSNVAWPTKRLSRPPYVMLG